MQVNLVFLKKDGTTSGFSLPSTVTFIGRRQDCDFCIPLMVVSRRHCEINLDFGKITVRDLKSRNGTLVNGQPIEEAQVKAGDVLKIGPIEFVIQVDGVPASFEKYLPKKAAAQAPAAPPPAPKPPAAKPQPVADESFEAAMEELSDVDLSKSRTEMLGEIPDDLDLDEDLKL